MVFLHHHGFATVALGSVGAFVRNWHGVGQHEPSCEAFVEAAKAGNLVPVWREIILDDLSPVAAYAAFRDVPDSFLLESAAGGERWGRYSFVGISARGSFTFHNGNASVVWRDDMAGKQSLAEWAAETPLDGLHEVMDEFVPVHSEALPRFWGGAVGWVTYDTVRYLEPVSHDEPREAEVPEIHVVLSDVIAIFDNLKHRVKVVSAAYVPRASSARDAYDAAVTRIDKAIETLQGATPRLPTLGATAPVPAPQYNWSAEDYKEAVVRAKRYIVDGDIFQVVLSRRATLPCTCEGFNLYRALRTINPSPYMYFLNTDHGQLVGASPETLVRLVDGQVHVRPIAGTRPRGVSDREDAGLARELLSDEKERAEHLMLVDLGRNDVGRVAETGSVAVTRFMDVERYSHVMHIVSDVEGRMKPGLEWSDALAATLPAGTLSGAPKVRAMQIIDELEPTARGAYGGAVGYIGYDGNMDVAISIRTAHVRSGTVSIQAGAGIVADSNPQLELEECNNKARALMQAIALANGICH